MSRPPIRRVAVVTLLCSSLFLGNNYFAFSQSGSEPIKIKAPEPIVVREPKTASTDRLGGDDRYLTMVSTDKPIYRSGETVYVRGVMLNAADHKPMSSSLGANARVEIKGPKGNVLFGTWAFTDNSVWGAKWQVPSGEAGGEYVAHVTYPNDGFTPAERKFDIRMYRAPRLKSQIIFLRDGYGPGETVNATLDVKRAEGGVPAGAKVTVNARIDGTEVDAGTATVDEQGLCAVKFDLPKEISRGEGTLTLAIEDGGVVETASKTIPILLQTVDLQMFPEGGDLIAGFKNRVYIQAVQPNGKPADLTAKLMSKQTGLVTEFKTEHEGRGRFEFTPDSKSDYYLSISKPVGIKTTYPLPKVKTEGAVIRTSSDVYGNDSELKFEVGSTESIYKVTLSKREVQVAESNRRSKPKQMSTVSFRLPSNVDGVLTATVWDNDGLPLAERLVFRQPDKPINITIDSDKKSYIPGDNAKVTIKTTDADGKPVSAMVGVTITDDSVLELIEKREQSPRLPVMVFLEPEVRNLADAHVYLDAANSKAPLATDLLLGTQGWRRFALMDVDKFIETYGEQALRVVALAERKQRFQNNRLINRRIGEQKGAQLGTAVGAMAGGTKKGVGRGAWSGTAIGAGVGKQKDGFWLAGPFDKDKGPLKLPEEIGRVEGPRDTNMFQVEPTVLDERHYTSGRAERHQKTSPTLPEGAPIPDTDGAPPTGGLAQLGSVDRYTFFPSQSGNMSGVKVSFAVKEFAHQVRPNRHPTDRVDFTETLYWNRGVKTDPKTGEATITFGLNDSVTTFKVLADAFTDGGAIATANSGVKAVQPFYAEAKLPLEVTAGDQILLPINLVNSTESRLTSADASFDVKGDCKLLELKRDKSDITSGERKRWLQPVNVGIGNGPIDFVLNATAGPFKDQITRQVTIKPTGFPTEVAFGGVLEPDASTVYNINIPNYSKGSMVSNGAIYPTPLANMTGALERLIQDPNGCFEQTCSTSYPLTMAQQYFVSHAGIDPKLIEKSKEKLEVGYKRLVSYWCPDRGYEWFGQNPGHEALTAFGILHFTDMQKVKDVDRDMLATTRAWLMKQKDGKGGFSRKRQGAHFWSEEKDCSNAYILWALLECGQSPNDLKPELASLKKAADASENSYVLALAANAFYLAGDKVEAKTLMDRLAAKQKADGSVDGIKSSIVGSGGESLEIEGTSLAALSWLREPKYAGNVEKSIKYLAESCKGGRYGTTQSTVLALRAIVAYDKQHAHPRAPGKVRAYVDGQPIGDWIDFNQNMQGELELPNLGQALTPGDHKLELRMQGGSPMPYSLAVKYNALTPASAERCKLDINVNLANAKVIEGNSTEANVRVTNKTKEAIPNPVAIVGLPGGLEPRHDQLKELVKKGLIDAYEVKGREVVLYWRALPAAGKVELPLSLIAAVPGTYTGPASRTYIYYDDEDKKWVNGLHVDIAPKQAIRETASIGGTH